MITAIDFIGEFLTLGGPVVAIIALLSVVALAIIVLKFFQFWRERVGSHRRAERALHAWVHARRSKVIAPPYRRPCWRRCGWHPGATSRNR